jgi:hypothetical protein
MLHEAATPSSASVAAGMPASSSPPVADLVGLKLSFNLFPATYAHPSWLARLGADTMQSPEILHSPLWVRAVSAALLRHCRLDRHFDCDFHDPAKRLALMDTATLARVGGLVLATLLRERLRRIVQRPQVQALHDCMGPEAHQFALRWPGAVPAIPAGFDAGESRITAEAWAQRSVALLFGLIPAHAIGVVERMRLRFPAQWQLPDPQQPRLGDKQHDALMALIVAVVADSAAHWSWLFADEETSVTLASGYA